MSYWTVLGLALLPALGNFGGGLLAEFTATHPRRLNQALHAAAGVVIAIVAVQLMPATLAKADSFWMGAAFGAGGVAYVAINAMVERMQRQKRGMDAADADRSGMWMIYIAVSVDLFTDGLLIGTGSAVSSGMALVLALGQVLADIPEGYATIANMKEKGVKRSRRLLLSASFAIPVLTSASFAYSVLRGQHLAWQMAALAFSAGLLTLAAVEDMLSEAHESREDSALSLLCFTGGFVLFTFVSAGLADSM